MPAAPTASRAPLHVVVMGVAGCGKTLVAAQLAERLSLPLIEGDDFHPASDVEKLRQGAPFGEADRAAWLQGIVQALQSHAGGAVLIWPALKRAERQSLRAAVPALHVLHLSLTEHQAMERAAARTDQFYPPSYVAGQFEALEDPGGEPGARVVDGMQHVDRIVEDAVRWLERAAPAFNNA